MNFIHRRNGLARSFCLGLVAFVGSFFAAGVQAQTPTTMRVDPVLLGLPPLKPEKKEVPKPAEKPVEKPVEKSAGKSAEKPDAVEIQAVEAPSTLESRPLTESAKTAVEPRKAEAAPAAESRPQKDASGHQEKKETAASPAPAVVTPVAAPVVAPAAVAPKMAAPEPKQPRPADPPPAKQPVLAATNQPVTRVAPFRVDPALLGQAPLTAIATAAPKAVPQGEKRLPAANDGVSADPSPALVLKNTRKMERLPKNSDVPRPIFLSASRMQGNVESEFQAEGNAELRKIGTILNADRLTYWPIEDEVEAEGQVQVELEDDLITGPKMRMKLEDQIGYFEKPVYSIRREPRPDSQAAADKAFAQAFIAQQSKGDFWNSGFAAPQSYDLKPGQSKVRAQKVRTTTEAHGQAERIDFEGENQVRLTQATYTTCAPGNQDWYVKVDNLKLDYDHEVGKGDNGTVYFKDTPIFYTPWMSFSLNNQRESGFLPPSFGTNSDSGMEFSLPYYWNIAPNMDATITPHVMTRRGLQLQNEFRYLNTAFGGRYNGTAKVEILPGDRLYDNKNRYAYALVYAQTTDRGFSGTIDYNKVSDGSYFTDLSSEVSQTSQSHLLQQGVLNYGSDWWSASATFQRHQTLQADKDNPVREPYKLLPQLTFNARKPDFFLTDSSFMGQFTHFTRSTQTITEGKHKGLRYEGDSASRTVLYPQIAVPYVTPGWYVTPKLGVNVRHYSISGQPLQTSDSVNVTLPIFSIDSGMTFERSSDWFGKDYLQTLEPRLFYVNIPYKKQSQIPIYDSGLADFNFAQIFSENQFSSWDRINNANQLTTALTSRLLDPVSGYEIMRAMIGQRFHFTRNRVELTESTQRDDDDRKWEKSDFLAAFSGQILPRLYTDSAWQYNLTDRKLSRYSLGLSYRPEPGKVLNAAYRYSRTSNINQVDVSGQWPLGGGWHGVGRMNYSLKDNNNNLIDPDSRGGRLIEGIGGLEYNGGCWVMRGVIKRLALTEKDASTSFFIQLELNDFARLGSNPLELLRRSVPGYHQVNQPLANAWP